MADKDPLDPSAVLHTTSQVITRLETQYDALAAAVHAIMLSVGFRFAGLGDDARQVVRMGDKCIILGMGIDDNKTAMLEIMTDDYTSASFFPNDLSKDPLVHGFISTNRFHDFIKSIKLNIIQRLIPGLNKPGYEDSSSQSTSTTHRPTHPPQPNPTPLGLEGPTTPYNPLAVGGDDLNPFGDRLRLPGSGGRGGGGMHVGPDHPIFGSGGFHDPFGSGGRENLPRGAVPPGARFDPITPPGMGFNPRGPRGPRGPRSGEPDNDELMPPGFDNMFG
ncbi:hypothetical protein RO3G_13045 [Rhizopus delemar RA 99-880]|uniref:Uncharacterized protein n=1 Tax=Rhizopus delemar (strain RA 99-880 / ATCC MYA-4621 / FGSC 9543 / NRRL 43880) TaxID=246409 RepID=I1CIQ4_RHIO9|nr:hypothetical protein RO3G_13045 [Rhizopus delemar RA 99-880]|eukprot:EIE88334.1 hypothetical protein RO3G_13045 [Rhizopus delemar RA 99-880]